jgi:hypothetical protein
MAGSSREDVGSHPIKHLILRKSRSRAHARDLRSSNLTLIDSILITPNPGDLVLYPFKAKGEKHRKRTRESDAVKKLTKLEIKN